MDYFVNELIDVLNGEWEYFEAHSLIKKEGTWTTKDFIMPGNFCRRGRPHHISFFGNTIKLLD